MGSIRTLKPGFFRSRSLAKCSVAARYTFAGLWCEADGHGRGVAHPALIRGSIWPLDDVTNADVATWLDELEASGHIRRYDADGDTYYEIANWEKHQAAAYRRGEPQHPAPPCTVLHAEACTDVLEGKGIEGKGRDTSRTRATAPQLIPAVTNAGKPAKKREPNPLWDALSTELGDANTPTEASNRGRTLKELSAAEATPEQVHARCDEYRHRYPDAALTDAALRKHWTQLATIRANGTPRLSESSQALARAYQRRQGAP